MKWFFLLFCLSLFRGLVFPDFRSGINIVIIPFLTPLVFGFLASWLPFTEKLNGLSAVVAGLVAIYFSVFVGAIVYGFSTGWHNIIDDVETQAVILATMLVQTLVFFLTVVLSNKTLYACYNK